MTDYPIPGEERTFRLPDLGEGLTEAEIVAWRVAVGDLVGVDDVVVDVETAKATVEVPCPHAGRVVTLHGAAGATIEVGSPLITVAAPEAGDGGDAGGARAGGAEAAGARAGGARAAGGRTDRAGASANDAAEADGAPTDGAPANGAPAGGGPAVESGAVLVGYGTGNATLARRARGRTAPTSAEPASAPVSADVTPRPAGRAPTLRAGTDNLERATTGNPATAHDPATASNPATADDPMATGGPATAGGSATVGGSAVGGSAGGAPRVLSPVVRRLARDHGVDVRVLSGSGPGGVILRRDVEAATANGAAAGDVDPAVPPAPPQRTSHLDPSSQREPLRGVRRAIAEKLARSRREIPDATTWVDVDATGLVEARDALREAAPDRPVGLLALLGRIAVAALTRFPELNASVEHDGDDLVLVRHRHVGLGFAAQTDRGLVVPVVHGAQDLTTAELAAELARLTEAARAGTLTPADLTGGTFTLNNYGVFGVDGSTPIINHPEAALLGVGRIVDKPWVVDGELAVRKVTQLSLSFDHRVCDGGVAGGFLRYVADRVESPLGLLLDL